MTGNISHISAQMRGAEGRVVDWRVSFPISESDIRRWAIATYYPSEPPRRYVDAAYARRRHGYYSAPEEFNPFAWMSAEKMNPAVAPRKRDADGLEKGLGIEGPGLAHQINGGVEAVYGAPMLPGDVVRSETRLLEYRERRGRLGLMLFTFTESRWTKQDGSHVRTERNTAIRY